jgi:hypothetical protein
MEPAAYGGADATPAADARTTSLADRWPTAVKVATARVFAACHAV